MNMSAFLILLAAFSLTALGLVAPAHAGEIPVAFDVEPGLCPNPITPQYFAVVSFPTAIPGNDSLDVSTLDVTSLVLVVPEGGGRVLSEITPIGTLIQDVATPYIPEKLCDCIDAAEDGFDDLSVYFGDELYEALGPRETGEELEFCIRGRFLDGRTFEGCDCVLIVGPTAVESQTWGIVKSLYR